MSKKQVRYWFGVENPVKKGIFHLAFAKDDLEACELLGCLRGECEVTQLTWRDMVVITGCVKPVGIDENSFVTFWPVFHHAGHAYCMVS